MGYPPIIKFFLTKALYMNTLFDKSYQRTLDCLGTLIADHKTHRIDVWLFETRLDRLAVQEKLRLEGFDIHLHSSYKPLVNHFLDRADLDAFNTITITYPVYEGIEEKRFLLECYPLSECFKTIDFIFLPSTEKLSLTSPAYYDISGILKNGQKQQWSVFAPNQFGSTLYHQASLNQCGWLRVSDQRSETSIGTQKIAQTNLLKNEALETEFEAIFRDIIIQTRDYANTVLNELKQQENLTRRPLFFEQLILDVSLPMRDQPLNYQHEIISYQEILHEELYFSLLELLEKEARPFLGEIDMRTLQTGQIIPLVSYGHGIPSLKISTRSFSDTIIQDELRQTKTNEVNELKGLVGVDTQLSLNNIYNLLNQLPGEDISAKSVLGKDVKGIYHPGTDKPVLISAAQHANETSATIGVMCAVDNLLENATSAHFALVPVENPDGYDMHQQFLNISPWHIHHALRYTALGDDLEYRTQAPLYEKEIRYKALEKSMAISDMPISLHINMHGYPSHEWTRPLTGYIPKGFAAWTIPKGMFLLIRYHTGLETQARLLMEHTTAILSQDPNIMTFNRHQLEVYEQYAGKLTFEVINQIPCVISEDNRSPYPLTVYTEYPDETLQGSSFKQAHHAQKSACLAIYQAWQSIDA